MALSPAPTVGFAASTFLRSSQNFAGTTHSGRATSGSAASISAVTPGGKNLFFATDSQSKFCRPAWFLLSGYMPIWLSTASALAFASGVRAAKLRPKTPRSSWACADDSRKPSGFWPASRGRPAGICRPAFGRPSRSVDDVAEGIDDLDRPVVPCGALVGVWITAGSCPRSANPGP